MQLDHVEVKKSIKTLEVEKEWWWRRAEERINPLARYKYVDK